MIATANTLRVYRVTRELGVVRGLTVRSRSVPGQLGASLQTLMGGNAVIAMRYDANEITDGVTEVLAPGTAV